MEIGLIAGVAAIGFIHGVLPDHGWPIAATYGLNHSRTWFHGTAAGLILGIGHLASSIALVLAYFWVSRFAAFAEGPWLRYSAGIVLILLGIHEYRHGGHTHGAHGDSDAHESDDTPTDHSHSHTGDHGPAHDHSHAEDDVNGGPVSRVRDRLFGGDSHHHFSENAAEHGLLGLGAAAFLLGFAHEEPIQILAICVGTGSCLELVLLYSLVVIGAILLPTLLLIKGYESHKDLVESYTPYFPMLTAVVLIGMGLAFIFGIF